MANKLRLKFDRINSNGVKLNNWRNASITIYANRGYSPVDVINYIDKKLLPKYSKYTPPYNRNVLDKIIPKVDKTLIKSLNVKLSVKFPPLTKMRSH